ncbi:hypothetical protein FKG94_05215 [Exilibacterium tricleocarpae]|uniref:Flagellar assembly protein FliH/Type III secretion system HrpE domain-containing protein n=1 Tax=Exilibacterium tricleocarpae TaxID=2591008 RepID=A0A545U3K6_9GAMM|nr:HrpE/YscL family type III secretion apparatus protein [Exilibacterium tricleocarpae]TQV84067.1 hypothetical protein FKG94_05215 [Exilibacterium tricleocarpae]
MLSDKKISLGEFVESVSVLPSILKNEDREIVSSYEDYILRKTIEADVIIEEAHKMSKTIARETREEAEKEFWKQVQAFYSELEAIKAAIIDDVEQQCCDVVEACLKKLLDTVPSKEVVGKMVNELLAGNFSEELATIYVHPDQLESAASISDVMSVPVKSDECLEIDSALLKIGKNQYRSSFKGKLSLLLRAMQL